MTARARAVPPSMWAAAAVALLFAALVPRFATAGNLENVLRVASVLALASGGQALVLLIGGIDFAMGASVAMVSVVSMVALSGGGTLGSLAAGASAAVAIGAVNAWLVAGLRANALVATLGVSLIATGLAAHLTGGMPLDPVVDDAFQWLGRGAVLGVPAPILLAATGFLMLHLVLAHTALGRSFMLLGINPSAAAHAGLNVRALTAAAYAGCGIYTAMAGVVLTSRVASGQPQLYPTLPFEAIAACALGGVSLSGGKASALQVLAGVLLVAMLNNAVVLLNWPAAFQQLLMGAVVIAAVAAQQRRLYRPAFRRSTT